MRSIFAVTLLLLFNALPSEKVSAATRTWSGSSQLPFWSSSSNWEGTIVPKANDVLVFPDSAGNRTNSNNLTATFGGIRFDGPFVVSGSPLVTSNVSYFGTTNTVLRLSNSVVLLPSGQVAVGAGRADLLGGLTVSNGNASLVITNLLTVSTLLTGNGDLTVRGGGRLSLLTTNPFPGSLMIESGTVAIRSGTNLDGTLAYARLGSSNKPVVVRAGASLSVDYGHVLPRNLSIAGAGANRLGAVFVSRSSFYDIGFNLLGDATVTFGPNLIGPVFHVTLTRVGNLMTNESSLPTLVKRGAAWVGLPDSWGFGNQALECSLRVAEGAFGVADTFGGGFVSTNRSSPFVLGDLTVGEDGISSGALAVFSAYPVFLPEPVQLPQLPQTLPSRKAITVHRDATLIVGSGQIGLGAPLMINGGNLIVADTYRGASAVHNGEILVGFTRQTPARISGSIFTSNTITIRGLTNSAALIFGPPEGRGSVVGIRTNLTSYLRGRSVEVENAEVSLFGNQGNQIDRLSVKSGVIKLRNVNGPSGARTNWVGLADAHAPEARLTVLASNQFPADADLTVFASGVLSLPASGTNTFRTISLRGGAAIFAGCTVQNLDLTDQCSATLLPNGRAPCLEVEQSWTSTGSTDVTITPTEPGVASESMIPLISLAGTNAIPRQFANLHHGTVIDLSGSTFRANYQGGDGNDLVLEKVSVEPVRLILAANANGTHTFTWPEGDGTCQLEHLSEFSLTRAWEKVEVSPAQAGTFSHTINLTTEGKSGFYRLQCP